MKKHLRTQFSQICLQVAKTFLSYKVLEIFSVASFFVSMCLSTFANCLLAMFDYFCTRERSALVSSSSRSDVPFFEL